MKKLIEYPDVEKVMTKYKTEIYESALLLVRKGNKQKNIYKLIELHGD